MDLKARIEADLRSSGLTPEDFPVSLLDNSIRAATNTPFSTEGYKIPYYGIQGNSVPFYRVKLFDFDPKYKQPKDTPNHVYFPRDFLYVAQKSPYIILTEGEKKAARACKEGFACCALGGTESWRNKILALPEDVELNQQKGKIQAKLPSGSEVSEDLLSPIALGMQDLLDYALTHDKTIIIMYDTDHKQETSHNVQRAAASLGYEFRFRGMAYDKIRQIRLPLPDREEKIGLDDYLDLADEGGGPEGLKKLIATCMTKRSAFPRHPNVRDYVNKRLQKARMSRKEMQQVAMAILCELDASGIRLRSSQALQTYYFDQKTHKLLKANFTDDVNGLADDPFGQYLYRTFGIGAADNRLVQWLGTLFTGEEPVNDVSPYRVLARPSFNKDSVIYQISDGQYVEVDGNPAGSEHRTPGMHIHDNGTNNVLFEASQVKPLDPKKLADEYAKQVLAPVNFWWGEVLNEVRLTDKNKQRVLTGLLFYVSPWLYRWRGTQLPIEMTLGEAGSGKSTLQELRLDILTGVPKLRNAPQDMKDWTASVTNAGGIHIIDNLQLPDKNFRNRLSDEICRIITEPEPSVEMRKLYTNADLMYVPVRVAFGITAIKQPFLNSDVLARSIIIELDKSKDLVDGRLTYDESWKRTQLERFGGREAWVAHHLVVLHRFFEEVKKSWNYKYQAKHRLINLEQALVVMAKVFGIDGSWIAEHLNGVVNRATVDADWAFEGLIAFAATMRATGRAEHSFTAAEIAEWAKSIEEYEGCEELTNPRRCGRYMQTHKTIMATVCGMVENGKTNNRAQFKVLRSKTTTPSQPGSNPSHVVQ